MADDRLIKGVRLVTVGGIDVRVNWSVAVIATLIAWSLADALFPEFVEGYTTTEYWIAGIVATLAFLAGLAAHELGHALVARRLGVGVSTVTLWMFGGVAELERSPSSPRDSLKIAGAGPAVSVAVGVAALLVAAPIGGLVGASLAWFGFINLLLAAFNLLPAFPMDGGRIFQAWRWQRTGDEVGATERAVDVGQLVGAALVGLGVAQVLFGGLVGGLWLMVIGWFLREAARGELRHVRVDRPLRDVPVTEIMTPDPNTVASNTSVAAFVASLFDRGRHAAYPVLDPGGAPSGLITLSAVAGVPRDDWEATTVGSVASPLGEVLVVSPTTPVAEMLGSMGVDGGEHRALVVDDGEIVGIVAPSDVARLVTIVELTGTSPTSPGAR